MFYPGRCLVKVNRETQGLGCLAYELILVHVAYELIIWARMHPAYDLKMWVRPMAGLWT